VTPSRERLDRHAAGRIVRRVARRAGLMKKVGPHTLRHTLITAAQMSGVASDAAFPGKRDHDSVRDQGTGSRRAACNPWRETAGQHGRVNARLRQTP
jgi:integrase